jgi:hypothetical protein
MKTIISIIVCFIIAAPGFCGRLGIGVAGGGEYVRNYQALSADEIQSVFYGAEFRIQAEALPSVYLEPSVSYLNNPSLQSTAAGLGLGFNVQPKLGRFPIVPSFGLEGTLLFYNTINLTDAFKNGTVEEYIQSSTPKLVASGFAGLNLFISRSMSLNCHYRYLSLAPQQNVEMVWAGLSYYFNW